MPQEWKDSIIVPILKKGDRMDCNNKILSNILLSRMTPYANKIIGEYLCGFTRNRSTVDHIFKIRHILDHLEATNQLIEKALEFNLRLYIAFVDYKKAFDTV